MEKILSNKLHQDTEMPGGLYDQTTQEIIHDRYYFAGELSINKNTLEIGPGSGIGIRYIQDLASNYTAIEYSIENIKILKNKKLKDVEIHHGDANNLPFENKFELIIALAMVYYLTLDKFLKEAYRCLEDEGKLFFCTSNKDVPGFCEAPFTTKYYSVPELKDELQKAGFVAEFYGAFPAYNKSLFIYKFKAAIKDLVKSIFFTTNLGKKMWSNIRKKSFGQLQQLTYEIAEGNIPKSKRLLLDDSKKNFQYKVIYVVATKNPV